jgi:hypothetical protein
MQHVKVYLVHSNVSVTLVLLVMVLNVKMWMSVQKVWTNVMKLKYVKMLLVPFFASAMLAMLMMEYPVKI